MPDLARWQRISRRAPDPVTDERYLEWRMFHLVACGLGGPDPSSRSDLRALASAHLPAARTWLAAAITDGDVGNGGFWQYFGNASGDLTALAVAAFREIGCPARADIVVRAAEHFFGTIDVPLQTERLAILDELARTNDSDASRVVRAIEDAYHAAARAQPIREPLRTFALARAGDFYLDP